MKIPVFFLLLGVMTLTASAAEMSELAAGYAQAFQSLNRSTASIVYVAAETETITNVKEIRSFRGVLLIKTRDGREQILDPNRVIRIQAE